MASEHLSHDQIMGGLLISMIVSWIIYLISKRSK